MDKKDDRGNKAGDRVCVELRKANELLDDDDYPIPTLQDVFNKLGEYNGDETHRSEIDCTAAYHGVETTGKRICFRWRNRLFMFKRAMFGIKPMTAVYQRVADAILNALDYAVAYIDDNIVSVESKLKCIQNTITVVKRFNENSNMRAAWDILEEKYPGLIMNGCGAHTINLLVKDISNFPIYSETLLKARYFVKKKNLLVLQTYHFYTKQIKD